MDQRKSAVVGILRNIFSPDNTELILEFSNICNKQGGPFSFNGLTYDSGAVQLPSNTYRALPDIPPLKTALYPDFRDWLRRKTKLDTDYKKQCMLLNAVVIRLTNIEEVVDFFPDSLTENFITRSLPRIRPPALVNTSLPPEEQAEQRKQAVLNYGEGAVVQFEKALPTLSYYLVKAIL